MSQHFTVLRGVQGNTNEAVIYLRFVPSLVKRKTPLAVFLIRKVSQKVTDSIFHFPFFL